ncbi:hypothetical protein ACFFRR_005242 [Megaselia abdita]
MVSTNIYNHHLIRNYDDIFHHISMVWYYANCFIKARSAMTAIEENLRKEQTFCEKMDPLHKFILPDIFVPHFDGSNIPWEHFLDHFKHSKMFNSQSTDSEQFKFLTSLFSSEALSVFF